jgi:hypothetical protein
MTWTPLKGPWTPPPELTGMTIPEICEELLRLRGEVARWEYLAEKAWKKADEYGYELLRERLGKLGMP